MTSRHFRPSGSLRRGADPIVVDPEEAGWRYAGLRVVDLAAGQRRVVDIAGTEVAVVPLEGSCTVTTDRDSFDLAGRTDVFAGPTDLAFVGLGRSLELLSTDGARVAIASAVAEEERPSFRLGRDQIAVDLRGAGQATRQITGLLSADVEGPQRLIVVEVLTPAGNWSSYPPHKHDVWSDDEVPIEEVYYFQIADAPHGGSDGTPGFGFHRTYTTDGEVDDTVTVANDDVYLVPRGYHGPCVAAPGYDMYYLNVMAGPDPHRRWLICNDPAHEWVMDQWASQPADPRLSGDPA